MKNRIIESAVSLCGGTKAVAQALHCTPRMVDYWITGRYALPFWAAGALEHLSAGRYTRTQFYPELHAPLKPLNFYTDRRAA